MAKSLKIMFVPMETGGHISSSLGVAQVLKSRGHHIMFAVRPGHQSIVEDNGMNVAVINTSKRTGESYGESELKMWELSEITANKNIWWLMKRVLNLWQYSQVLSKLLINYGHRNHQLKLIIQQHNPDILIVDDYQCHPSLIYSGRPWVWLLSANQLILYENNNLIPAFFGFNSNERGWKVQIANKFYDSAKIGAIYLYKLYFALLGYPANPENRYHPNSPYLNIYGCPKELDYNDQVVKYPNTIRIDLCYMPNIDDKQDFSPGLKTFIDNSVGHKLILVSFGMVWTDNYNLVQSIINILSQSEHRFIIAKGFNNNKYEFGDNIWTECYLPQRQVLPLVDAVITHGGNNTLIESLAYGKPSISFPLIVDQMDNAQRVDEQGYGVRLSFDTMKLTLLNTLDQVLNDTAMKQRLTIASKRMLSSDSLQKAAILIENLQYFK